MEYKQVTYRPKQTAKKTKVLPRDRIFSYSSVTAPLSGANTKVACLEFAWSDSRLMTTKKMMIILQQTRGDRL